MSDRLRKLVQYLEDGNYEMAVTIYNQSQQLLSQYQNLELGRAFLANQYYQKCVKHCQPLTKSAQLQIVYDASILLIKARYLLGQPTQNVIKDLINKVTIENGYEIQHILSVKQLCYVIGLKQKFKGLKMNKQEAQKFGRNLIDQLERDEYENVLVECMPMFVISARWYQQFERFVGYKKDDDNNDNPGPLTNFEIVDHRYNLLFDTLDQKKYTNYVIYPNARFKIISKVIWMKLYDVFGGIELKRYNVWIMGKPKEIMTEIYLKKIKIKKIDCNKIYEVQITKKQTWGGLTKKLRNIWHRNEKSVILFRNGDEIKQVAENSFLEQVDTIGNVYLFGVAPVVQNKNIHGISIVTNVIDICKNCGKTTNLKFCQCKCVKYCNQKCQKEDRDKHRKKCQLQYSHLKQKAAVLDNFNLPEKTYGGRRGLVGLRNLGNTCYMNSGLQCLSNIKQITDYFMNNNFIKELNQSNPLGTKGYLACAYAELIREMWTGSNGVISPFNLKKIIGKYAGQFSGYGQQDSQQFISYLIDGLQEDLNLVKNKQTFQSSDEIIPDEQASRKSEQNYQKRIKSSIRDLMAGQFKSTVVCGVCQRVSVCFDPFLLLTLPIPSVQQKQVYYVGMDSELKTKKIIFTYDNVSKLRDLRIELNKIYEINEKNGNFINFASVDLEDGLIIQENLRDDQNLMKYFNRIGNRLVLIGYQFVREQRDEIRYKIDYVFKGKKISFPRFVNILENADSGEIIKKILKGVVKYDRNGCTIEDLIEVPEMIGKDGILIRMKKDLSMLICVKQNKVLRLQGLQNKVNLGECLQNFTKTEILEDSNKWYCNKCKQFVKASKQMEIYKSNKVLVLAFKRFNRGFKVKDFIEFPIEGLNIGSFVKSNKDKKDMIYDLYGVVNHYGTMFGGHYTAYCRNFISNQWHQFDDSRVSKIRPNDAVTDSAYVLFYRRRN